MEPAVAQQTISGTTSGQKNELLFKAAGINYNEQPEAFRKGTFLFWRDKTLQRVTRDIIRDDLWTECPWLLE